jgi:NAD+ synthetase
VKIALAQINTTVGDFAGNLARVRESLEKGRRAGVDLVVFPEQTIPGYPAEDLLERADFLAASEAAFAAAVDLSRGTAMVIGTISRAEKGEGNPIYNSAVLVDDGRVAAVQHKTLLPTHDVFDEGRYFRPATSHAVHSFRGRKLGLAICEDLWNDPVFWPDRRYTADPAALLAGQGAEIVVAISASPFSLGRGRFRYRMLRASVERHGFELVYANLVGGNTTLVFDGASFVLDRAGRVRACAPPFEEAFVVVDTEAPPLAEPPTFLAGAAGSAPGEVDVAEAHGALVLGVRDYLAKSGFRRAVLGLSGGVDSAITAAIAAEAIGPENVIGVSLPSRYSSRGSLEDAQRLAAALGIAYEVISIEDLFKSSLATLAPAFAKLAPGRGADVTEENLQARIRGLLLMGLSNKLGALLLTTGNKSELAVGYCTLYGDMSGGLAVVSDVPKTLVYRLASWINRRGELIPASTIEKPPSAELRPEQKDEDSLPPYAVLDPILQAYIEQHRSPEEIVARGFERATVEAVVRLVDRSEYKRKQGAPGIRITTKAFGPGRRFPIVQRFR